MPLVSTQPIGIAVGTAAERGDVKKIQGALMILVGSQVNGGAGGFAP